jgi:hypothetical protein
MTTRWTSGQTCQPAIRRAGSETYAADSDGDAWFAQVVQRIPARVRGALVALVRPRHENFSSGDSVQSRRHPGMRNRHTRLQRYTEQSELYTQSSTAHS